MLNKDKILRSSVTNSVNVETVLSIARGISDNSNFRIENIALSDSSQWNKNGDVVRHETGKFFSIEALLLRRGNLESYVGPILNQPEIGYLGIVCSEIDGVLKFLLQFKIEPGNVNSVQLSPTLQATKSNFSKVHGGSLPKYFDFFSRKDKTVVCDTLQTEQGAYFFQKRNRNIIIFEESPIKLEDNFIWLTLKDIYDLLHVDDLINMDTRTVLSMLSKFDIGDRDSLLLSKFNEFAMFNYTYAFLGGLKSIDTENHIFAQSENISIGMYRINIDGREVASWDQPLLSCKSENEFNLIFRRDDAKGLLFALSLKTNGGIDKAVEFHSTELPDKDLKVIDKGVFKLSEEGGRFFQMSNYYNIIEISTDEHIVPNNHVWATYNDLAYIIVNGLSSMELRTLKLCFDAHSSRR